MGVTGEHYYKKVWDGKFPPLIPGLFNVSNDPSFSLSHLPSRKVGTRVFRSRRPGSGPIIQLRNWTGIP